MLSHKYNGTLIKIIKRGPQHNNEHEHGNKNADQISRMWKCAMKDWIEKIQVNLRDNQSDTNNENATTNCRFFCTYFCCWASEKTDRG